MRVERGLACPTDRDARLDAVVALDARVGAEALHQQQPVEIQKRVRQQGFGPEVEEAVHGALELRAGPGVATCGRLAVGLDGLGQPVEPREVLRALRVRGAVRIDQVGHGQPKPLLLLREARLANSREPAGAVVAPSQGLDVAGARFREPETGSAASGRLCQVAIAQLGLDGIPRAVPDVVLALPAHLPPGRRTGKVAREPIPYRIERTFRRGIGLAIRGPPELDRPHAEAAVPAGPAGQLDEQVIVALLEAKAQVVIEAGKRYRALEAIDLPAVEPDGRSAAVATERGRDRHRRGRPDHLVCVSHRRLDDPGASRRLGPQEAYLRVLDLGPREVAAGLGYIDGPFLRRVRHVNGKDGRILGRREPLDRPQGADRNTRPWRVGVAALAKLGLVPGHRLAGGPHRCLPGGLPHVAGKTVPVCLAGRCGPNPAEAKHDGNGNTDNS